MILLKDILFEKKRKREKKYLSANEVIKAEKKFGPRKNWKCSILKDDNGYYCHTHRARSKSKKIISKITKKEFDFISSTS